jgi:hypothetical protein
MFKGIKTALDPFHIQGASNYIYSEELLRLSKKIQNGNKKFVKKKKTLGLRKGSRKKNRRFKRIDSSQKAKL